MDLFNVFVLALMTTLFTQETKAEVVSEAVQKPGCTVIRAEVAARMPCGSGYITERDACWDCGCCFVSEPDDSELVTVCYSSLNATEEPLDSSNSTSDASKICNRSFKDVIGMVTVERIPNWELLPSNNTVLFVIKMERILRRMTTSFHYGDGFSLQNISFLKTEERPYHEARIEYTYRCPGDLYQPRLEVQGQAKAEDRLEFPAGPAFNVTQKLFVDHHEESNGSTTFAIYANPSDGNITIWVEFDEGNASVSLNPLAPFNRDNLPNWALKGWADRGDEPEGYRIGLLNHFYERLGKVRPTVHLTNTDCAQNLSYQMEVTAGSMERFRKQLENVEVFSSSVENLVLAGEVVEMIAWIPGADNTSASFEYGDGQRDEGLTVESVEKEWPAFPHWAAVETDEVAQRNSFIRLSHVYSVPGEYQGYLTVTHDEVSDWTSSVNVSIRVWSFKDALGRTEIQKNTSDSINPFDVVGFAVMVERVFRNLTLDVDFGDNSNASDDIVTLHGSLARNSSETGSVEPGSAIFVHQYGYQPGIYIAKVLIAGVSDPERMQSVVTTSVTVKSFPEAIGDVTINSLNRVNLVLCDLTFQVRISHPWPFAEFSVSFGDGTPAETVTKETFQLNETPNGTFHVANVMHRFIVPGFFQVNLTVVDTISANTMTFSNIVEVITVKRIVGNISLRLSKGDTVICKGEVVEFTVTVDRLQSHHVVVSIDFGDGKDPTVVLVTKNALNISDLEQHSFVATHRFKQSRIHTITATALNPCTTEDRFQTELRLEVLRRSSTTSNARDLDRVLLLVNPAHARGTVVGEEVEFLGALPEYFEEPRPVLLFQDGIETELSSSSALNCLTPIPDWLPTEYSFSSAGLFSVSHRFPRPGIYHARLKVTNHPGRAGPIFAQARVQVLSLRDAIGSVRIVPEVSSTGFTSVFVLAENFPPNTWTLWDFGDGSPSQRLELERNVRLPEFAAEFATPRRFSGLLSHTYQDVAVHRFSVRFQIGNGGAFRDFTREKTIVMEPCDEMAVTLGNSADGDFRLSSGYHANESIVLEASYTPACYPKEFAGRCVLEKRDALESEGQSVRLQEVNCSVDWVNTSSLVNVTIHPSVLRSPGYYYVGVEVQFVNSGNVITRAQSNKRLIKIDKRLLTIHAKSITEYNVSETLRLTTTLWQDLPPTETVTYTWICLVPGSQPLPTANNIRHVSECITEPYLPDPRSKSSLELPVSWLSFDPTRLPVVFQFQARLSTPNGTLVSDWISLTVVSGATPLISIVCLVNCEEQVDPSVEVLLSFSCGNCGVHEKLVKSWDLHPDQPETSAKLSILSEFLQSRLQPDSDVFAIPGRIFESLERDEVFTVSLNVRRRDATQSSSFRRLNARQSTQRNRITPGPEEIPVVPMSSFSDSDTSRVLTPAVGALHYDNASSLSATDGGATGSWAALAAVALLVPGAAILVTVVIHRKRRRSKEGDGRDAGVTAAARS